MVGRNRLILDCHQLDTISIVRIDYLLPHQMTNQQLQRQSPSLIAVYANHIKLSPLLLTTPHSLL